MKFCVSAAEDEAGCLLLQHVSSPFTVSSTAPGFKENFGKCLEIVLVMRELSEVCVTNLIR